MFVLKTLSCNCHKSYTTCTFRLKKQLKNEERTNRTTKVLAAGVKRTEEEHARRFFFADFKQPSQPLFAFRLNWIQNPCSFHVHQRQLHGSCERLAKFGLAAPARTVQQNTSFLIWNSHVRVALVVENAKAVKLQFLQWLCFEYLWNLRAEKLSTLKCFN